MTALKGGQVKKRPDGASEDESGTDDEAEDDGSATNTDTEDEA